MGLSSNSRPEKRENRSKISIRRHAALAAYSSASSGELVQTLVRQHAARATSFAWTLWLDPDENLAVVRLVQDSRPAQRKTQR